MARDSTARYLLEPPAWFADRFGGLSPSAQLKVYSGLSEADHRAFADFIRCKTDACRTWEIGKAVGMRPVGVVVAAYVADLRSRSRP
jgi:hypothetical protein